jgi:hypothetical protein
MLPEWFVFVGITIDMIGVVSYVIDTLKGKIKPNRVSFTLWSLAPLIAFYAQLQQGVGLQSFFTLAVGVAPLMVLIASFMNKKAEWKLTRFDLTCGALSIIGLILWQITKVGNIAIVFSILADGLAGLPIVVKSYKYPETEAGWPWLMAAISGIMTLLTITDWNFANYGFPLYLFGLTFLIYILVKFKLGRRLQIKLQS